MIYWRDGKAGFVGASKYSVKGFFQYRNTVTTETVDVSIWTDATGNASVWTCENPIETTWDTDSTFWDLDGNVFKTLWDNLDDTWSDETGNNPGWTDV